MRLDLHGIRGMRYCLCEVLLGIKVSIDSLESFATDKKSLLPPATYRNKSIAALQQSAMVPYG